jgi:hypothetical protein
VRLRLRVDQTGGSVHVDTTARVRANEENAMKSLKLLLMLVVCGFASSALADPVACPGDGNPGLIGAQGSTFLDVNPAVPDATQEVTLTVGQFDFIPSALSTQVNGDTINVLLAGQPIDFTTPPTTTCLSTEVGPLAAGSYTLKVVLIPTGAIDPSVAATSPLDVAEAPGDATLPITGAMTSNWYDPAHSGEGIIVQIAAFPPDDAGVIHKELVFDWFTFDTDGHPFWIAGNAPIDPADPTVVVSSAVYFVDGGFAGDFGDRATEIPWGTVTFSFPDLDHMTVEYDTGPSLGTPPPPALLNAPAGSGTLHWQRLLSIAGLCAPPMLCTQ